ncbi:MAG: S41 family peptidase [Planctomycetota bacterium]|nr:S41 family peptidase [Planctomycetota bacterium]
MSRDDFRLQRNAHASPSLTWTLPVAAAVVLGLGPLARAQELTREQMGEDLDQLTGVIQRAWAYLDDKTTSFGVDIEEFHSDFRDRIGEVGTKDEFLRILQEYIASLKDGHARVTIPGVVTDGSRYWAFGLVDTEEGILVKEWDPKSLNSLGIQEGDTLVAVDGRPIEDRVRDRSRRVAASTDTTRRYWALRLMTYFDSAESFEATLRNAKGEIYRVQVPTTAAADRPTETTPKKPPSPLSYRKVRDGVGYIRLTTFQPRPDIWYGAPVEMRDDILAETKDRLRKAFDELRETEALILDLRGNSGGTDLLGQELARHLIAQPFVYYSLQTRFSEDYAKVAAYPVPNKGWATPHPYVVKEDRSITPYTGRLYVLIDEGCFSATDNFLSCIADLHPDVTFVGRRTGAGTGAPTRLATLKHSGAQITLPVMVVRSPHGRIIEGRGTQPNISVRSTRSDLLERRDAVLEASLKAFEKGKKSTTRKRRWY